MRSGKSAQRDKNRSKDQGSRYRGIALLFAMACLISACGQPEIASGTATPGTVDTSRGDATNNEPTGASGDQDDDSTVLPGATPVSDASGPGQQGWLPVVSGPVQPDDTGAIRGEIDSPGKVHVYTFEAIEGQHVLVDQLGGCQTVNGDSLDGRLEGPGDSGFVSFDSDADNCFDIDEFVFTAAGTATLTIEGENENTTGNYSFRLVDTTTPPPIALDDGMIVSPDSPAAGAGQIEQAGFNDHYQIQVTEGDAFTIQQLDCALSQDDSLDVLFDGIEVSGYIADFRDDCDSIDRMVAQETGTVDMIVRSTSRVTGTYSFAFNRVNDGSDEIQQITLGDSSDVAAAPTYTGAIDEFGQINYFTFDLTEDQYIVVEQAGNCNFEGGTSVQGNLLGAGIDSNVYLSGGDCNGIDRFRATESGEVILKFQSTSSDVVGTYDFRVMEIPVSEDIPLESGDIVEANQPVEGAGNIDALGAWDRYVIDVEDNQTVRITPIGTCTVSGSMSMKVVGEIDYNTAYFYSSQEGCFEEFVFEAEETGTLVIIVGDQNGLRSQGNYGFKVAWGADSAALADD